MKSFYENLRDHFRSSGFYKYAFADCRTTMGFAEEGEEDWVEVIEKHQPLITFRRATGGIEVSTLSEKGSNLDLCRLEKAAKALSPYETQGKLLSLYLENEDTLRAAMLDGLEVRWSGTRRRGGYWFGVVDGGLLLRVDEKLRIQSPKYLLPAKGLDANEVGSWLADMVGLERA